MKNRKKSIVGFITLFLLTFTSSALAIPQQTAWTQWSGNGHYYSVLWDNDNNLKWTEANAWAQTNGVFLATITTFQENEFVFSLVNNPTYWSGASAIHEMGPWLGGKATNRTWEWVPGDGATWGEYTNWGGTGGNSQPNYLPLASENEFYLHFWNEGSQNNGTLMKSKWADTGDGAQSSGYNVKAAVLERTSVPEPATMLLFGFGLLGLAGVRRKLKK